MMSHKTWIQDLHRYGAFWPMDRHLCSYLAPTLRPPHLSSGHPRPMHGLNMMLDLKKWIDDSFPYWKRRGGRDHIWLAAADEGACWMPTEIYQNSIVLTHWGR